MYCTSLDVLLLKKHLQSIISSSSFYSNQLIQHKSTQLYVEFTNSNKKITNYIFLVNEKDKKLCTKVDLVFIRGTSFRGLLRTSLSAMKSTTFQVQFHSIAPDEVLSSPKKLVPLIKTKSILIDNFLFFSFDFSG